MQLMTFPYLRSNTGLPYLIQIPIEYNFVASISASSGPTYHDLTVYGIRAHIGATMSQGAFIYSFALLSLSNHVYIYITPFCATSEAFYSLNGRR
jgi:hypothetical protein